jgi:hypothetical protein
MNGESVICYLWSQQISGFEVPFDIESWVKESRMGKWVSLGIAVALLIVAYVAIALLTEWVR